MNCCLQKTHYTSIYIFYLLFKSREVPKSKKYENPTSTSKVTYKTIFIILFDLFCICNSFEFKFFSSEWNFICYWTHNTQRATGNLWNYLILLAHQNLGHGYEAII